MRGAEQAIEKQHVFRNVAFGGDFSADCSTLAQPVPMDAKR
jgi:hypothetical protein